MNEQNQTSCLASVALLTLLGCAATADPEAARERERRLYGPPASAREDDPQGPTPPAAALPEDAELADYLAFGLRNSADLRAAFEDWRAAAERIELASTLPDPKLSFAELLEEIQTRTGPQERRFGISQAFPWPGKLGQAARVAERRAEASWQRVRVVELEVVAAIEVAYHEYAFLGRELRITQGLLELLQGLEPVVQSRVAAGRGQADILRLQVEIGRLEDDLASLRRRRPVLSARLADAMNLSREAGDTLPLPELEEPVTHVVDVAQSYRQALANSPGLRELEERLEASREAEALASYRRKPSFSLGVDYIQTDDAVGGAVSGSGDDPLILGLSMTLPIWTGSYAAAERERRHARRATQERLDSMRSSLRAGVESEAFRIDDATRKLTLYRSSLIPRASEGLDLTLASYRAGESSILDLIDAERALLEFELAFWRACREYHQGAARLRALTAGGSR